MIVFRFLLLSAVCFCYVFATPNDHLPKDCYESQSVRVVNWNIMAPMWVEETTFHPALVDRSLFNATRRFNAIVKALKGSNADIILLQEVQQDWLQPLQNALSPDFALAIYGQHLFRYWSSHLPRYRIYKANGGAIFYRTSKLFRYQTRSVRTTPSGNIVTLAAFALKRNNIARTDIPRIIVANGQLERGLLGISTRRRQVKAIQTALLQMKVRQRTSKPAQIIWSGDFNTFVGLDSYKDILNFGYENVFDDLGIPNPSNYYGTLGSPHTTSYTFVENSGLISGRIRVIDSYFDPAEETRSDNQVETDRILARVAYMKIIEQQTGLNQTQISSLYGRFINSLQYDLPLNIALRRGSDHTYQRSLFCLF